MVSAGTSGGIPVAAGASGGPTSGAAGGAAGATASAAGSGGPPAAGSGGPGTSTEPDPGAAPVCTAKTPDEFELNARIGGGSGSSEQSAHFAVYSSSSADTILNFMEAAHKCFIDDWCFRTPSLSVDDDEGGPYYKLNIYSTGAIGAGGLTHWDAGAKLSYIQVLSSQAADPRTTVHEYGHAITMSEFNWIEQKRTGYWWETVANWVSYSFLLSPYCKSARDEFGIKEATTILDQMRTLETVYGQSYKVICNDQNYYQAWPFLTYLTNNPDNYPGLGKLAVQDLMRKYKIGSNETPLHTLDRNAAPVKAQTIVGRYWARMAYMDIGLPVGQKDFLARRDSLNYAANLDSSGSDTYKVKSARQPQYFGANMTPLQTSGGEVSVTVTPSGGKATSTLAIMGPNNTVRYVDLPDGSGSATIGADEEVTLVVVNTPDELINFDPQYIRSPENVGLDYTVKLTGATPAN
ncbi:MAG: DUF6055 domain-containing protein [Polyangiales bacterium]